MYKVHISINEERIMFDSIEIRKVTNGFIVILNTEDDANEYVFDTSRKAIRFIKDYVEAKNTVET